MTVSLHNRCKLEDAMGGLLAGTVMPPDGKLTWKSVAVIAGVSKATADRAVDLREEFRRQLEERVPSSSVAPKAGSRPRTDVNEALARLRQENTALKESTKVLHSVILALVQENQRLARHRQVALAGDEAPTSRR